MVEVSSAYLLMSTCRQVYVAICRHNVDIYIWHNYPIFNSQQRMINTTPAFTRNHSHVIVACCMFNHALTVKAPVPHSTAALRFITDQAGSPRP